MAFLELENQLYHKLKQNKSELKQEQIREIDPEIITKYNSVNVFLGKAGSGKSFNILQTFAKISLASPNTHLIVYITKTGRPNDKTFDLLSEFIRIPIIFCSFDNAVEFFDYLIEMKELYRKIKEGIIDKSEVDLRELYEVLHINNLKQDWLHTIIYFEDAHKNPLLYGNKNLYFIQRVPLFRHDNCSYYFAIQLLVGFPTDLKIQITDLILFPGYSKQQIRFILDNVNVNMDRNKFIEHYGELEKKQFININNETGDVEFY